MQQAPEEKPAEAAAAKASAEAGGEAPPQEGITNISCSRGLASWLQVNQVSLAFTSYQTGQLFLVGAMPNGSVSFHQRNFARAMGLWADKQRIYLATLFQIWRLENSLRPGEVANQVFDRLYTPRNSQVTGDIDVHELALEPSGRIIFVNTLYSCLSALSLTHGFQPLWKPPFISKLAAEDRCHLNGLAMDQGKARYVSAVCRSDVVNGWRDRRAQGGLIMDVTTDKVLTEGLSMPHSPRVHNERLYVLDSGRGYLSQVDRNNGALQQVAFCPGFMRGLTFWGGFAIVGLSLPRDTSFSGLELDGELKKRDAEPWCGIQIIDLRSGDVVQWIRLDGHIRELFDVTVLPGVRCPMAVGLGTPEIQQLHTFDTNWGKL